MDPDLVARAAATIRQKIGRPAPAQGVEPLKLSSVLLPPSASAPAAPPPLRSPKGQQARVAAAEETWMHGAVALRSSTSLPDRWERPVVALTCALERRARDLAPHCFGASDPTCRAHRGTADVGPSPFEGAPRAEPCTRGGTRIESRPCQSPDWPGLRALLRLGSPSPWHGGRSPCGRESGEVALHRASPGLFGSLPRPPRGRYVCARGLPPALRGAPGFAPSSPCFVIVFRPCFRPGTRVGLPWLEPPRWSWPFGRPLAARTAFAPCIITSKSVRATPLLHR